jgi:hypothetical protein
MGQNRACSTYTVRAAAELVRPFDAACVGWHVRKGNLHLRLVFVILIAFVFVVFCYLHFSSQLQQSSLSF